MILALSQMSFTVQAILFGLAVVCFLLAAFRVAFRLELVAVGLALFVFVAFWNSLALA